MVGRTPRLALIQNLQLAPSLRLCRALIEAFLTFLSVSSAPLAQSL
jgi:hypothetical protein